MRCRLAILAAHRLGLRDIQQVIAGMGPLAARASSSTGCATGTRW